MAVDEQALFFDVFIKVLFQSIMWGIGTAIGMLLILSSELFTLLVGELPPYFVARAARLSGQKLEDLDEITDKLGHATSLRDKLTKYSYELLQRFGFWGILMFASVRTCSSHVCLTCYRFRTHCLTLRVLPQGIS